VPTTASPELFAKHVPALACLRRGRSAYSAPPDVQIRCPRSYTPAMYVVIRDVLNAAINRFARQCCADALRTASSALASAPRAAQRQRCRECRKAARKNQHPGAKSGRQDKGPASGVFKLWIRLYKTRVTRSRCDADYQLSHQYAKENRGAGPGSRGAFAAFSHLLAAALR